MIKTSTALMLVLCMFSCERPRCDIEFLQFNNSDSDPFLVIQSKKGECEYRFSGHFFFRKESSGEYDLILQGNLSVKDSAYYIFPDSLFKSEARFFDFTKRTGDNYDITFSLVDSTVKYNAVVDTLVKTVNYGDVFLFRVLKSYPGYSTADALDVVYVVTTKKGIVGSFISKITSDSKFVVGKRGDLLPSVVDYSATSEGSLH